MNYENILNELIQLHEEYGFKPYYRNGKIHTGQCTVPQMERLDSEGWKCTSTSGEYSRAAVSSSENINSDEFGRIEHGGYKFRVTDGFIVMR